MAHALPSGLHTDAPELAFESFGVKVAIGASDPTTLSRMSTLAPPGARAVDPSDAEHRFTITQGENSSFDVRYDVRDGKPLEPADPLSWVATAVDLEFGLALLDSYWHNCVALNAPVGVFVQGGVIVHRGRAILLPGRPLTGRTTLIGALVRAGAVEFSDEYGVLDERGHVHQYGEDSAGSALPLGAIVMTSYHPAASWSSRRLSVGQGVLAVLAHAVPAQARPREVMQAINQAMEGQPPVLESLRGEADETAEPLLREIEDAWGDADPDSGESARPSEHAM